MKNIIQINVSNQVKCELVIIMGDFNIEIYCGSYVQASTLKLCDKEGDGVWGQNSIYVITSVAPR